MSKPLKKRPTPAAQARAKKKSGPKNDPPFYRWTESKLLPCPFCGHRDVSVCPYMVENPYPTWLIRCRWCGAQMVVVTKYQSQLIAEWNNRQPPQPLREIP